MVGTIKPKDKKLLYRFYEPLVLLRALGKGQGDRVSREQYSAGHVDTHDVIQNRRTLLDQLCIVCDFDKGGTTTTAMLLESKPSGPTYWVSCPKGVERKTAPFLRTTLELLAKVALRPEDAVLRQEIQEQLFQRFAMSCKPRLIKTWLLLQKAVTKEEPRATSQDGQEFWSRCRRSIRGDEADLLSFCEWAYSVRKSPHLRKPVAEFIHDNETGCTARHFIGRIASVYRAAKVLTMLAPFLVDLLGEFDIKAVPSGTAQTGLAFVKKITLDGMAGRMTSSSDEKGLVQLQEALSSLDRTMSLMAQVKKLWNSANFEPQVHAELELLEAAYRADIDFYDEDRYIACSKAACFCCYYYICHHPGKFEKPAAHNNLWLNWRAPDLPHPESEADATVRKRLLNAMVAEFRAVVKRRILEQSGQRGRPHPDSTTGITHTATISNAAVPDLASIDEFDFQRSFEQLDLGADEEDVEEGGVALLTR